MQGEKIKQQKARSKTKIAKQRLEMEEMQVEVYWRIIVKSHTHRKIKRACVQRKAHNLGRGARLRMRQVTKPESTQKALGRAGRKVNNQQKRRKAKA